MPQTNTDTMRLTTFKHGLPTPSLHLVTQTRICTSMYISQQVLCTCTQMCVHIYICLSSGRGVYIYNLSQHTVEDIEVLEPRCVCACRLQVDTSIQPYRNLILHMSLVYTQRLQSSSFLVMTYFLLRDYNIQPKRNYFGASGY